MLMFVYHCRLYKDEITFCALWIYIILSAMRFLSIVSTYSHPDNSSISYGDIPFLATFTAQVVSWIKAWRVVLSQQRVTI